MPKKKRPPSCHVSIYLEPALKAKAEKKADGELLPLSSWLRRIIAREVDVTR